MLSRFFKVDAFPNLLSAFVIGESFEDYNKLTEERIISDCMWLLERTLRRILPRPTRVIPSRWITEPNFLGSYSFLSVDTLLNDVSPAVLGAKVYNSNRKPILFFAGEATDAFYGYANGAVTSGHRVADEVIKYNKATYIESNKLVVLFLVFCATIFCKKD